jgi:hypothetical protein
MVALTKISSDLPETTQNCSSRTKKFTECTQGFRFLVFGYLVRVNVDIVVYVSQVHTAFIFRADMHRLS